MNDLVKGLGPNSRSSKTGQLNSSSFNSQPVAGTFSQWFLLLHSPGHQTISTMLSACHTTWVQLLLLAVFSSLSQLQWSSYLWTMMNIPKKDDLVFGKPGKVVVSYVGQWKVPLQQASDPGFLMPLVLHLLAELHFSLAVVMSSNFRVKQFHSAKPLWCHAPV